MNVRIIALCVLFFVASIYAPAAEISKEIPGGVVASNGKDAIYYDFATKEKVNLTADLKDAAVNGPFAISEDGKTLIWVQGSKVHVRRLPSGGEKVLKGSVNKDGRAQLKVQDFVLLTQNRYIKNLTISPMATQISYESEKTGKCYVQVPPGSPLDRNWLQRGLDPSTRLPYVNLPMYVEQIDTAYFIEIYKVSPDLFIDNLRPRRCGNGADYPGAIPYRTTYEDQGRGMPTWQSKPVPVIMSLSTPMIGPGLTLTPAETIKRFSFKRDGRFGAWSKDNEFFAVIYQTPFGWGPIEIHNFTELYFRGGNSRLVSMENGKENNNPKPGIYEILLRLKNCDGLAWKPDGSLTFLTEEKVFSLAGTQIKQGIANSGIAQNPERTAGSSGHIPVNNVFQIESAEVAYDIHATKLYWTSDYAFIFRSKEDGGLYSYDIRDKTRTKILYSIPEDFFYCRTSPLAGVKFVDSSTSSAGALTFSAVSGKDKSAKTANGNNTSFEVGSFKAYWGTQDSKSIRIRPEQKEFALLDESDMENVKNPAQYEYQALPIKVKGQKPSYDIKVSLNQIVVLKNGNSYSAIKPVELEPAYNSVDEMPQHMQKSWKHLKGPPPFWKAMTYEWKFWPNAVLPGELAKTALNK